MKLNSVAASVANDYQFRAHYYYLLSKLLSEPPTEDTLRATALYGVPASDATNRFLVTLNGLAQTASEPQDLEQLDDEYHDLFVGIGRGELVPYGSWYITGMMMDKPLSLLRHDLKALGIERVENNREPEDHISALFDVMGIVIDSGTEFQFKTQVTLFDRHLKPWVRRFFKDLVTARKAEFYRKVGEFGVEFMNFETDYLEMPT